MNRLINLDRHALSNMTKIIQIKLANLTHKSKIINNTLLSKKNYHLDNMIDFFDNINEELRTLDVSFILDEEEIIGNVPFLDIYEDLFAIYEDPDEDYVCYSDVLYGAISDCSELLKRENIDYDPDYNYTNKEVCQILKDIDASDFDTKTGIDVFDTFNEYLSEYICSCIRKSKTLYISSPHIDSILEPLYNKNYLELESSDVFNALLFMGLSTESFSSFNIAYSTVKYDPNSKYAKYGTGKYILVINVVPYGDYDYSEDILDGYNYKLIETISKLLSTLEKSIYK